MSISFKELVSPIPLKKYQKTIYAAYDSDQMILDYSFNESDILDWCYDKFRNKIATVAELEIIREWEVENV